MRADQGARVPVRPAARDTPRRAPNRPMKLKDFEMSKDTKATGQVSIKLKTGLRRGNITATAGETVEVGPGLARRLVDRGQATFTAAEAKRIKAKEKTQKEAAEAAKAKKAPAPKLDPDPAGNEPGPVSGEPPA